MATPRISNRAARHLFLDRHALAEAPTGSAKGDDLLALIKRIGFVQVDSINTVARAHHMILFARRQSYRQKALTPLLERECCLFEHWTHDASIIPTEFFPYWKRRFAHDEATIPKRWENWQGAGFVDKFDEVLTHIRENGPVKSSEVGEGEKRGSGGWWEWNPSKAALEYLWRSGKLSVARREGFQKVYDLTERVLAADHCAPTPDAGQTIAWACSEALDRLGFATSGEIAGFWRSASPVEARDWCKAELAAGRLLEVEVEGAEGDPRRCFIRPDILASLHDTAEPVARLRILSPFDPALRDRKRAERLFGFHYRIEIYVPEPKRQFGYYVFPILEGDRLIGRIDMKCDRDARALCVKRLWLEPGVKLVKGRLARLEAELARMARFAECDRVVFTDGWV